MNLQIGRHFMVGVIGKGEVAGQINLHTVSVPDCDGRQNVQEFVENALRGLAHTLSDTRLDTLSTGLPAQGGSKYLLMQQNRPGTGLNVSIIYQFYYHIEFFILN